LAALVVAVVLLAGCGGYVGRARRAYNDGRYLDAAERLAEREHDVAELSSRQQAEYGLYRGLSLLMLGDATGAHRWLSFAYEIERQEGGALKAEQRGQLDRGWAQLAATLAAAQGLVVPPGAAVVVPVPGPPAPAPAPPATPPPASTPL
jgi:hypothetical protein